MSMPNIPNINATISITLEDSVNLLLASVAFEELGLSHIINAEAEKIQYVLGTLDGQTPPEPATIDDLLKINNSVNQTLKDTIKTQILLQFQLEDLINYEQLGIHVNTASVTAVFEGNTYYASDSAYYHTTGGM